MEKKILNPLPGNDKMRGNHARQQEEMRRQLLRQHPFKIYQGSDGRWTTYLPTPSGRIVKKRKRKKDLEDLIIEFWEDQGKNPTFQEIFDEWNDRRRDLGKISDATHERYRQTFIRHCTNIANIRIRDLSADILQDFLEEELYYKEMTAKSFSNLNMFL